MRILKITRCDGLEVMESTDIVLDTPNWYIASFDLGRLASIPGGYWTNGPVAMEVK